MLVRRPVFVTRAALAVLLLCWILSLWCHTRRHLTRRRPIFSVSWAAYSFWCYAELEGATPPNTTNRKASDMALMQITPLTRTWDSQGVPRLVASICAPTDTRDGHLVNPWNDASTLTCATCGRTPRDRETPGGEFFSLDDIDRLSFDGVGWCRDPECYGSGHGINCTRPHSCLGPPVHVATLDSNGRPFDYTTLT